VDELGDLATDPDAVRLAAWYHDAVYEGRSDDEERSACMAEVDLSALGVADGVVVEVARLIRMTVEHNPAPDDRNGAVLSDADLSSLAVSAEEYRRNSAAIRAEYAHVVDTDFGAVRARIIRSQLSSPALYRTPVARERWERAARVNLAAELESLT
jgi:predicted metal-dependent HD superfamily phosphohydrolase